MFVIRLPNGNLMVPESAIGEGGRVIGDAYVEIGPEDADYERLAENALTEEEARIRRQRWQEEDEALQREFLAYRAQRENSWPGENSWSDPAPHDGHDPA
jgi:hypothetical protein